MNFKEGDIVRWLDTNYTGKVERVSNSGTVVVYWDDLCYSLGQDPAKLTLVCDDTNLLALGDKILEALK